MIRGGGMRGRRGGSSWRGNGDEGGLGVLVMEMGRANSLWRYMNELGQFW